MAPEPQHTPDTPDDEQAPPAQTDPAAVDVSSIQFVEDTGTMRRVLAELKGTA